MTTQEKLDTLVKKLGSLSEERKALAVEALEEIVDDRPYVLTEDERAILEPALAEAKRLAKTSSTPTSSISSQAMGLRIVLHRQRVEQDLQDIRLTVASGDPTAC